MSEEDGELWLLRGCDIFHGEKRDIEVVCEISALVRVNLELRAVSFEKHDNSGKWKLISLKDLEKGRLDMKAGLSLRRRVLIHRPSVTLGILKIQSDSERNTFSLQTAPSAIFQGLQRNRQGYQDGRRSEWEAGQKDCRVAREAEKEKEKERVAENTKENTVNTPQVSVRKEPKPDTCRVRDYVFEPRVRLRSLPNVDKDSE
ncbi:hypothetical protein WH47_10040 [Habropoda laboriosa]|uniref:Uncharacterized protein n=1 Tax=Habropoda laboriosa TaxID=597456 RepID=A0A0L7R3Y5_9HYME|nr:hypothetical protein WH47_10040 [Habropoda laboriosa]